MNPIEQVTVCSNSHLTLNRNSLFKMAEEKKKKNTPAPCILCVKAILQLVNAHKLKQKH